MTDRGLDSSRPRLNEIDGLRAIACLMILVYHTWQFADLPELGRWIDPLNSGVDVFIVLSGFCLFLPVFNAPERFGITRFWRQRIRRIVPAYYASIVYVVLLPQILVVFWRLIGKPASWQPLPDPLQWITHLTFTHTLIPETIAGINGSYWSLGLEAQFYLVMPVLVLLFKRYGWRGLLMAAVVSLSFNAVLFLTFGTDHAFDSWPTVLKLSFLGRWVEFVAGALAAFVVHATMRSQLHISLRTRSVAALAGLGLFIVDLAELRGTSAALLEILVLPVAVSLFLLGISSMPQEKPLIAARVLRWRPLRFLGTISYSFYLIHQPTEWFFSQFMKGVGVDHLALWVLELTLGAGIVTVIAWLSYLVFEKPFLRSRTRKIPVVSVDTGPGAPRTREHGEADIGATTAN